MAEGFSSLDEKPPPRLHRQTLYAASPREAEYTPASARKGTRDLKQQAGPEGTPDEGCFELFYALRSAPEGERASELGRCGKHREATWMRFPGRAPKGGCYIGRKNPRSRNFF